MQTEDRKYNQALNEISGKLTDFELECLEVMKKADPDDSDENRKLNFCLFVILDLMKTSEESILKPLKQRVFDFCFPEKIQQLQQCEKLMQHFQKNLLTLQTNICEVQLEQDHGATEEDEKNQSSIQASSGLEEVSAPLNVSEASNNFQSEVSDQEIVDESDAG